MVGGAGHVGLITGLGLAELGHSVVNVDVDDGRIAKLRAGESPISEEGIVPVLTRDGASGRLRSPAALHEAPAASPLLSTAARTPRPDPVPRTALAGGPPPATRARSGTPLGMTRSFTFRLPSDNRRDGKRPGC